MPTFRNVSEQAAAGCLVKPLLITWFLSDEPMEIAVRVQRSLNRAPDDWFHASTHPTMTSRELYLYLAHPERHQKEAMGYAGKMGTMFGTIWHDVVRLVMTDHLRITVPVPKGTCPACGLSQPAKCKEHGARDLETRSRGHLDNILDFKVDGTWGYEGKSIYSLGLGKVPDMDLEYFKEKWPKYYYQVIEYMRLTGLRRFIVLFMSMGSPWEFREFHVPFDPVVAHEIEFRYRGVLAAVREGRVIVA